MLLGCGTVITLFPLELALSIDKPIDFVKWCSFPALTFIFKMCGVLKYKVSSHYRKVGNWGLFLLCFTHRKQYI